MIDLLLLKSSAEATASRGRSSGQPAETESAEAFDSTLQQTAATDDMPATDKTAQAEDPGEIPSGDDSAPPSDDLGDPGTVPEEIMQRVTPELSAEEPPDELASLLESWSGVSAALGGSAELALAEGDLPKAGGDLLKTADTLRPATARVAKPADQPDAGMPEGASPDASAEILVEDAPATVRDPARAETRAARPMPDTTLTDAKPVLAAKATEATAIIPETVGTTASTGTEVRRVSPAQVDWRPVPVQAHAAIRQIADAVVSMRENRMEIALSPEELGRVRMIVTGAERSAQVTVWVERPEIMDMMRRNLGLLTQHFGEAGLENASFEFREGSGGEGWPARSDTGPGDAGTPPDLTALTPVHVVSLAGGGFAGDRRLDIRL